MDLIEAVIMFSGGFTSGFLLAALLNNRNKSTAD
jgi:hypothetical protein